MCFIHKQAPLLSNSRTWIMSSTHWTNFRFIEFGGWTFSSSTYLHCHNAQIDVRSQGENQCLQGLSNHNLDRVRQQGYLKYQSYMKKEGGRVCNMHYIVVTCQPKRQDFILTLSGWHMDGITQIFFYNAVVCNTFFIKHKHWWHSAIDDLEP